MFEVQDWESAAGIAKAFAIGRAESSAVLALLSNVPGHVCSKLNEIVKIRGMTRFLTHDVIGKGTFSIGWTSGVLACEGWSDQLTNSARDHTLVTRMCIQEFRKVFFSAPLALWRRPFCWFLSTCL